MVAPVSMRKVSICNWPCSDDQRVPFGAVALGANGRHADPRAGDRIVGEPRQPVRFVRRRDSSAARSPALSTPVTGFLWRVW